MLLSLALLSALIGYIVIASALKGVSIQAYLKDVLR